MYEFSDLDQALAALSADQSDLDRLTAQQKEAIAAIKHDHVIPNSMVRASNVGGSVAQKWGKKFVCLIATKGVDGSPDGNFRIVATSDLHQVHHLEAVKKALKKATSPTKTNSEIARLQALLAKHGIETKEITEEADLAALNDL